MKFALLILVTALLLQSCAAIRLAYDNADAFVRWRASDFIDLNSDAASDLDERIAAFHAWHRASELPRYSQLASEAARRIDDGVSPGDIEWGYDALMARARESMREAAERVAPVLDRLAPEQVKQVEKGFADDNRKFAREHMRGSEKDRRQQRFKRTRERLEDWVGRLSDEQLERVRRYADTAPLARELQDQDRRRLQAQILDIIRAREAQKRLAQAALDWRAGRDPAYQAANEEHRRAVFAMIVDLDKTLTPQQRSRASARMRGFAEDFDALSGQGQGQGPAKLQQAPR